MNRNTMQYYLKIVRKGYNNISAPLGLATFVLLALAGLFAFVLLVYEPANEWHTTTFTLSRYEYRYSRGVGVLDLYTTDGRCYVLNQNEETIRYQLKQELGNAHVYAECFDITDGAMRHAFCQRVMQEFGAVDVLVNCAGANTK